MRSKTECLIDTDRNSGKKPNTFSILIEREARMQEIPNYACARSRRLNDTAHSLSFVSLGQNCHFCADLDFGSWP